MPSIPNKRARVVSNKETNDNERTITVKLTGDTVTDTASIVSEASSKAANDALSEAIAKAILWARDKEKESGRGIDAVELIHAVSSQLEDDKKEHQAYVEDMKSLAQNTHADLKDRQAAAEILRKEAEKELEKAANARLKSIDATREALNTFTGAVTSMKDDMKAALGSINDTAKAIMGGDISGVIGGAQGAVGDLGKIFGDMVADGKGGSFATGAAKAVSYVGAALDVAKAAYEMWEQADAALDQFAGYRRRAINATGSGDLSSIANIAGRAWTDRLYAMTSSATADDINRINAELMKGGASYGDDDFSVGKNWSIQAADEYGISAQKAAQLYSQNVLSGAMSAQQLSKELNNLQETVKETGKSMDEVMSDWEQQQKEMHENTSWSGNGAAIESALYSLYGDSEYAAIAAGRISAVQSSMGDKAFRAAVKGYAAENDVDEMTAMLAVTDSNFDSSKPVQSMRKIRLADGLTIGQYLDMGDADSFRSAIDDTILYSSEQARKLAKAFESATGKQVDIDKLSEAMTSYFFSGDTFDALTDTTIAYSRATGRSASADSGMSAYSSDRAWRDQNNSDMSMTWLATRAVFDKQYRDWFSEIGGYQQFLPFGGGSFDINTNEAYDYMYNTDINDWSWDEFNRLNVVGDAGRQEALAAARQQGGQNDLVVHIEAGPEFQAWYEFAQRRKDRDRGVLQYEG